MPYRSFRRRRRMPMRRRRRFKRKPMTVARVKRIVGAELKFFDLGVATSDIPTVTGQIHTITNIGVGTNQSQRIGNWISAVTWMGTITLQGNSAAAVETAQYRVGCIQWRENQNVDPIELKDFMQDTSAPHQQYSVQGKGSFKVLWSRIGILSNDENNPQFQKMLRFYVKPRSKVLYDGATFRKYHLFLFAYSDTAAAANPPTIMFDMRLRYTDS